MNIASNQDWHQRAKGLSIEGRAYIDGEYVGAASGEIFACINPANGRHIVDIASGDAEDIDRAVKSARRAFDGWARMGAMDRKRILLKFSELILANKDELGLLETLNVGKPITNSTGGDIPSAANCIAWNAEAVDKFYGEVAPGASDMTTLVVREPLGIVGAVVPWNYPLSMAAWKLGPALATGNCVILKPAEQSPLTAIRIAALATEAGIPKGVLNVVPGFGEKAGRALGLHPDVDCVTFTGSTEVGKLFLTYSGMSNAKRVSLELGGKSPQIVLADCASLDDAAKAVAAGIFSNAGQICNAGSRLIVEDKIKGDLIERVVAIAKDLVPGDPLNPATRLGPVVDSTQLQRILQYIDIGQKEGARVVTGGAQVLQDTNGFFIQPTVFDNVASPMRIAQEEIFGPVLSAITVSDFDQALQVANDTIYGLAASIWTNDLRKAHRAAKALRAGVVWVNCFDKGSMSAPFGGFKQSGFGRDKSLHALEKYTDLKSVWISH
ncbi:aldehyde dehydrogenase [Mesorhizobium retamae]|uniref:Aldehyde dehydrogenase n=1 Tax=Mesorhizobium retamae TaxID=2912854 RepID=A0ABS9QFI4_9HYPH|nr:aldehyde dehydrogenase [Mesorhizobium sp. IRAMC:0171]MCG7505394.1 aldehyde dehydrogenase [Mesorhizobium sp. IRAMC:0171]